MLREGFAIIRIILVGTLILAHLNNISFADELVAASVLTGQNEKNVSLKGQGFLKPESTIPIQPQEPVVTPDVNGNGTPTSPIKSKAPDAAEKPENLVGLVFFQFKTYTLPEGEKRKLDSLPKDRKYRVIGYTDSIGSSEFNNMLAILRANAVSAYLRSKGFTIAESFGRGKCCYVDLEDETLNRRVEIFDIGILDVAPAKPKEKGKKSDKTKFMMLADLSMYGTRSELKQGSTILGGNGSMVLAPTVQYENNKFMILLFNSSYQKKKQVFTEDQGPRSSSEYASYSLSPTFKIDQNDRTTISTGLIFTKSLSRESADEKWYRGLYDYGEYGVSLDLKHLLDMEKTSTSAVSINMQRYKRTYPNFISLFSVAGFGSLEEHEKDFTGTSVSLGYMYMRSLGWSYSISAVYVLKDYMDKLIENEVGARDLEKQKDNVYTVNLSADYKPDARFRYGVRVGVSRTESNQNLVEGSFPFFLFHENYYSNTMVSLVPDIGYTYQVTQSRMITIRGSYSGTRTKFDKRRAKDSVGDIKDEVEIDFNHSFSMNAIYTMDDHWSIGAILEMNAARSNVEDERFSLYKYEIMNASLGFSYHY